VNTLAAALLAAGLKLVASHAYPDGAPPGFSGGFKEESCHACHFHSAPNAAGGRVTIEAVPERYIAGQTYILTIALSRTDMKLAGFQLTARFKSNGAQAGSLAPRDATRVSVERAGTVEYANHTKTGSAVSAAGVSQWSVEWTAPSAGEAVVFHVAGNAADGNGSADGDFVYTASVESAPAAAAHPQVGRGAGFAIVDSDFVSQLRRLAAAMRR
jgi:hypothetical protein